MELEEAKLGDNAVGGREGEEVGLEVGDDEGLSGCGVGERYAVESFRDVAVVVLYEALLLYLASGAGEWVGLYTWLEVCEAVSSQVAFEWVFFIWGAFGASSCFLSLCHAVKVKTMAQR